jgi:hypothetical protein
MNLKQQVSENIKESRENSGGDFEELDEIEVDYDEIPFVKLSPTTLVQGTFPEDEGNPIIRFWNEQNTGRKDQGYLGLVMDDITVNTDDESTEGTVVVHDPDDSTDYRVFNTNDDRTDHIDDVGVKVQQQGGSALYDGDVIGPDEFTVDRAIVIVSGNASTSVARRLDVKGEPLAEMAADGEGTNGALIELNPSDDGPRTRYARDPELKEGLYGTEVGVMLSRREEVDDEVTGYTPEGESTPVLGTADDGSTHSNPVGASYAELVEAGERRSMYWYSVFNMETEDLIEQTADEEPVNRSFLEWRWDEDAETLTEDEREFIEEYEATDLDNEESTIIDTLEQQLDNFEQEPDRDAIVAALT